MICIWDKESNKQVDSFNSDLYIGSDGIVYKINPKISVDSKQKWITREDVSNRYEVRYYLDLQSIINSK